MLRYLARNARPLDGRAAAALRPYAGVTARLLYARGIYDAAQADAFLHPDIRQLHDPMRMHGMRKALAILARAKEERLPTVVYGDYDVDGVCACALLTQALRRYGVDAQPYTPLRAEGYGLNAQAVTRLAKDYRVLVTVDLGITNHEEVRLAQSLGMLVIVTDHHGLGLSESPADAVMNPLLGDYPFRKLCGTGVAFKLAQALLGTESCLEYLDLAALATVADIVPLADENRVLVSLGLKVIESRRREGMRALMRVSGEPSPLDSAALGYRLGPRLNAAGRLDDAGKGVRLMLTQDPAEADRLADELDRLNTERKTAENSLVRAAEEKAAQHDFIRDRVLIVRGKDWHVGVIGLAAGRLCQKYSCPTCVLSESDGLLHGSLRSVPGVHIHNCLKACDSLLLRYGGHEQAAGVTLPAENYEAFYAGLQAAVAQADESCFIPAQEYDDEITLDSCTDALLDELTLMAPFGCGNPAPLFLARGLHPEERRAVGADGAHLKLTLRQGSRMMGGIAFSMGRLAASMPDAVDAVFSLGRNTFRGVTSLQLEIKAITPVVASRAEALHLPDGVAEQEALLNALLDAFAIQAGNAAPDTELIQEGDWDSLRAALTGFPRGHLLVSRTHETALRALNLGDMDVCAHAPDDPRGFATLLTAPVLSLCCGHWRHVWLLDGEALPGEAELWRARLPQAQVCVLPQTASLRALASAIDAGDASYRVVYKALRGGVFRSLGQLADAVQLTGVQARAGLNAFSQLGLIDFTESPFRYALRPAQKCALGDSPVLGALRRLAQGRP
ncbi:MAG: single-stranded-DNA-specific exonuclease RecJ [Clostridiales bacterium]|nr:single-stranded-DNA-specific exonuclease RecJ [Clostridiales bacterium]